MSRYLLDTNICVHYMKGEFGLIEQVDAVGFENCFLSEVGHRTSRNFGAVS